MNRVVVASIAIAAALVGGIAGQLVKAENDRAIPKVVEGWAAMPLSMTAIACCGTSKDEAGGPSYLSSVAHWRDLRGASDDDSWHEGADAPPCYTDSGDPFRARIGVVQTEPTDGRIGTRIIAWLECL